MFYCNAFHVHRVCTIHQLSRRNLHELDKVALLEAKRPILERQAKERQGARTDIVPDLAQCSKGRVRDQLAAEAGVSKMTYTHLRTVNQKGSEELKEAVREKKIGFHFEDLVRSRAWGN